MPILPLNLPVSIMKAVSKFPFVDRVKFLLTNGVKSAFALRLAVLEVAFVELSISYEETEPLRFSGRLVPFAKVDPFLKRKRLFFEKSFAGFRKGVALGRRQTFELLKDQFWYLRIKLFSRFHANKNLSLSLS